MNLTLLILLSQVEQKPFQLIITLPILIVILSFVGFLAILLYLYERQLHGRLNKEVKSLKKRLTSQRTTYETIAREQTQRIDELQAEIIVHSRMVQSVLNLAQILSTIEESKDIPKKLIDGVNNVLNTDEILFFESIKGGRLFKLKELLAKDTKKYSVNKEITYPLGVGPIGYVGKARFTMDKEDMEHHSLVQAEDYKGKDPYKYEFEVISPLVHQEKMFGVLALNQIQPFKHVMVSPDGSEKVYLMGDKKTAVRFSKEAVQMVTELGAMALYAAQLREQLQKLADTDGLTNLYNKRYILEHLNKLIEQTKTRGIEVNIGLFMMDIDHFKNYNDTNGHPAGDDLLRHLGKILKTISENIGIPARYGGEEFLVILPGKSKLESLKLGEMIRRTIEQTKFPHQETQPNGNLTVSGGIAVFPEDAESGEELISKADEALYYAKQKGKNCVFASK